MTKMIQKRAILMLMAGLLFVIGAPAAEAKDKKKCRNRSEYVPARYYHDNDNDRYRRNARYDRDRDYDYRDDRRYRDRDYDDYDREDTTGNAVKRTAIGAGIGALGGAVIGGKKGALIGAGVGAAGGYIYHRKKVGDERDRYRRRY
jgi:hypothetical protein